MTADKGHVVHINSATLVMGGTGTGKSSLLATLVMWVWEHYGLITVIASTDGGGIPTSVQALIRKGIVYFWRLRTRDLQDGSLSFETCSRATQGWLPKRIDPTTGATEPGVQLVPPITESYEMRCPQGHVVKVVPFQSLLTPTLCPTCKQMTDRSNMQVVKTAHRTKGFEKIGAVCFDGLTSMLSWMMQDMGQRAGRLELKGEEGAIGGKIISGDMKFGGSSRSHYGFAQARAEDLVLNALSIPHLVVPPVFTALTLETDDDANLRIRGPKLAGKAKTDEAGAWFGNALEAMVVKDDKERQQFRLCLSEFVDDQGVRHLIKHRGAPGTMPTYLEDPPLIAGQEKQTAFTQFNLGVFFDLLDKARTDTEADIDARFPNAPGVGVGIVEVGEPSGDRATAPVTTGPSGGPAVGTGAAPAPPVGKPSAVPTAPPRTPIARAPVPQPPPQPRVQAPAPAPVAATPPSAATTAPVPVAAPALPTTAAAPSINAGGAWAPPAAPRPPAPAPRVGARTPGARLE